MDGVACAGLRSVGVLHKNAALIYISLKQRLKRTNVNKHVSAMVYFTKLYMLPTKRSLAPIQCS